MDEQKLLAEGFESNRSRLRGVAYRMLGSASEAEDAVQEAWLRLSRHGAQEVENLGGWLTTVVARVCLDMLRSRKQRREEPLDAHGPERIPSRDHTDFEREAELADAVGLALVVVLDKLVPDERVVFVLHDMFGLSFDEIAPIVGRTSAAARQLASRARRRVQGTDPVLPPDQNRHREIIEAFLAASRKGDIQTLLALLAPDAVLRADPAAARLGGTSELRGAAALAKAFAGRPQGARAVLVDGVVGVVVAPGGRLLLVLNLVIVDEKIAEIDAIAEPEHLRRLDLAVIEERP